MALWRALSLDTLRTVVGASMTLCRIVLCANRLNDWNTIPTSERNCASLRPSDGSTTPSIEIVPESMVSSRLMVRHNVDLPEPDGPSTTITWPRSTFRLMSLSTCRAPKCLLTASIEIIGAPPGVPMGADLTQGMLSLPGTWESVRVAELVRPYHGAVTSMVTREAAAADAVRQQTRTYQVRTYGCQMNVHDSERLAGLLEAAGYERAADGADADVVVFNTCAVRENADNKLYGNLSHLAPRSEERRVGKECRTWWWTDN